MLCTERLKSALTFQMPNCTTPSVCSVVNGRVSKRPRPGGAKPSLSSETASPQTKCFRSLFSSCKRLINSHDVNGGILVPVNKAMVLTSQHAMDHLGLVQDHHLITSLVNLRHNFSTLATTLGSSKLIDERDVSSPNALQPVAKPGLGSRSIAATGC